MAINSEEGILKVAVVQNPMPGAPHSIEAEHGVYIETLKKLGVLLLSPTEEIYKTAHGISATASMYCRDPLWVIGEKAYCLTNPLDNRSQEIAVYQAVMEEARQYVTDIINLQKDMHRFKELHGGDFRIAHDGNVIMGRSTHEQQDEEIMDDPRHAIASHTEKDGFKTFFLTYDLPSLGTYTHLDGCVLAPLPRLKPHDPRKVLVSHTFVSQYNIQRLGTIFDEIIPVPQAEDRVQCLATNFQPINPETLISHTNCPQTNALLRAEGYDVRELPWHNTQSGAVWRCMTGELHRE